MLAACAVIGALAGGCGHAEPAPTCPADHEVAGVCAGVPLEPLCEAAECTDGVACATVLHATTDAELQTAIGSAKPGTCISLAPGSYGAAALPGGVSLLGRSADDVHLTQVSVAAAAPAQPVVVRGLEVKAGGVDVAPMASATLLAVRVIEAPGDAVHVGAGASLTVDAIEITSPLGYGVYAADAASVVIKSAFITGAGAPGVHAACSGGCACAAPWEIQVSSSALRKNGVVGVSIIGVRATLTGVEVTDNAVGQNFVPSGGISASQCADLVTSGVKVLDNASFGVLVDTSSATLGASDAALEVSRNLIGLWIQKSGTKGAQPVTLTNCTLEENAGVGIGLAGEANGIIIHDSHVKGTKLKALPALDADGLPLGSKEMGDGLNWQGGASATIDGLELSGSARASLLINGSVGPMSSIANVSLSGGDEQKGIVEQGFPTNGTAPAVGSGAPPIEQTSASQFAIPAAPAVPAAP